MQRLKVFLCWLQGRRWPNIPAFEFWHPYLRRGLVEAGADVVEASDIDWIEGLVAVDEDLRAWRDRAWTLTLDFAAAQKPDVFLSYLSPRQIDEAAVKELKRLGVVTVNFYCDNIRDFTDVPHEFRAFDINWVPEFSAREMYRRRSLTILSRPMPVAVPEESRNIPSLEKYPPTFIGSFDVQRRALFEALARSELPFEIRGTGWVKGNLSPSAALRPAPIATRLFRQAQFIRENGVLAFSRKLRARRNWAETSVELQNHVRSFPTDSEYLEILRDSVVAIGVSRVPSFRRPFNSPLTYSRLRDLEAPMVGSCYLTEYSPGLEELYEIGTEIETYRSAPDLVQKLRLLTADPARRARLRRAGQKRALSEHTVKKTIQELRTLIGDRR